MNCPLHRSVYIEQLLSLICFGHSLDAMHCARYISVIVEPLSFEDCSICDFDYFSPNMRHQGNSYGFVWTCMFHVMPMSGTGAVHSARHISVQQQHRHLLLLCSPLLSTLYQELLRKSEILCYFVKTWT